MLQKWAKAIEKLDYKKYSVCEAYPRSWAVFNEIYKDDYFTDIMVIEVGEPDEDNIKKDYKGNAFIRCSVSFEGAAVKRGKSESYQIIRGDIIFIKFIECDRSDEGWLISNRTIIRVDK